MSSPQLPAAVGTRPSAPVQTITRAQAMVGASVVVALGIAAASAYGLLADEPYRSLPEATVFAARGQDVVSLVVAVALVVLALPARLTPTRFLAWLGLLAYVVYSYAIYLTGVPMNRVFLVYVLIVCLAGAGLLGGLLRIRDRPPASTASPRLTRTTGWVLVVTAVLFAGLWLSVLVPYALGGSPPDPEGVGGTPYPVFVLDLAVVLPAIAAVGVLLLRGRAVAGALAAVAMLKILTLFTALWAGPLLALATDADVHLGPDAVPSLLLLAASAWLTTRWLRSFKPVPSHPVPHPIHDRSTP